MLAWGDHLNYSPKERKRCWDYRIINSYVAIGPGGDRSKRTYLFNKKSSGGVDYYWEGNLGYVA
jgi:hypothetical protein